MTVIAPLTQLGSLDTETFLRDYWQQKPCLIRHALPGLEPVVSPDELAGMACEAEVESRLLITDPGNGRFELLQGPFSEHQFAELPDSHWTLLVQGVDLWLADAAHLVQQFRFIPSWRLDDLMISYATTGGSVGPHYDNYDVFIIQAAGRRRWEIGGHYREQDTAFLPDQPVRILEHWQPEQSWELEPGDMLYIPPRVGHNGVALSDDCVNYSVGYRAQHAAEMLQHFADYCAQHSLDELRYSDPNLSLRPHSGEIRTDDLEQVRRLMQQLLNEPDQLRRWWGEYVTEAKHPEPSGEHNPPAPEQLRQQLNQAEWVRRGEGVRFAYSRHDNGGYLFVDGQRFDLTPEQLRLAQLLCDQNQYPSRQISAWLDQPDSRSILSTLFASEQLYCL